MRYCLYILSYLQESHMLLNLFPLLQLLNLWSCECGYLMNRLGRVWHFQHQTMQRELNLISKIRLISLSKSSYGWTYRIGGSNEYLPWCPSRDAAIEVSSSTAESLNAPSASSGKQIFNGERVGFLLWQMRCFINPGRVLANHAFLSPPSRWWRPWRDLSEN